MATAVKIVDISKGFVLDSSALRQILLRDETKEKPACVISIVGAFRDGKSFLLNFFIRYLTITCKEKKDVANWLRPEDGPITGFCSKGGSNRVTTGILIWSEIFIVQRPSGEEVAVILLDTQGAFDNESTMENCAAIFTLSTLISSVQIYNLKQNIKSTDLDHLQYFLGYGNLLKNAGDDSPFQKILFLIRDWQYPEEYNYGMEGGNNYLQEKILNTDDRNMIQELKSLRKGIKSLFEEINCYLLPHPGIKVPKINFSGELKDIDTDFKEFVEMLAVIVLAPRNLTPKVINGELIKVKNLVRLFENYCEQFKSKKLPKVLSIYKATAKAQCLAAIEEAEEMYEKEMKAFIQETREEKFLLEKHRQARCEVFQFFNDKKIISDEEIKLESRSKLEELLEKKFKEYKYYNLINLQNEHLLKTTQMFEKATLKVADLEEQTCMDSELKETISEMQAKLSGLERLLVQQQRETNRWREEVDCVIL